MMRIESGLKVPGEGGPSGGRSLDATSVDGCDTKRRDVARERPGRLEEGDGAVDRGMEGRHLAIEKAVRQE
jgi:hypothetical protein